MATVTLKALKKSYAREQVLHGVDVQIHDGELVVVVGPSGCGKSTLLRLIAGLETVTSGEVWINSKLVNDVEPMDRNIAMVFQNYALYPHMTVFNNMAYSLKIAGLPKHEIAQRVEKAAATLQMSEYLHRKPRQLSGGQRQRVAMGRALVRKPAVFLFDEPLSNLDAKLRVQMRLEIRKLQRELAVTAVYVTHDQTEAMTLGDRLIVLNDGVVEQFGTPIELYQRPASLFVARFIGSPSMTTLDAVADKGVVTLANGATLNTQSDVSGSVVVGIRPEHFVIDPDGPIKIATGMLEQLGSNTLVHGTLENNSGSELIVSLAGICTESTLGDQFRVSVLKESIHLFDQQSGRRIE